MPKGAVPERYRDILESTALGHLATIGPDGRPQVNPAGFEHNGVWLVSQISRGNVETSQNERSS